MALITQPIPDQAREGLARLGLAQAFDSHLLAAESFIESEQAFRKAERVRISGFAAAFGASEIQTETESNNKGLTHLDTALSHIARGRVELHPDLVERINKATATDDFRHALARVRDSFVHQMTELDFHTDDFQEILGMWDRHSQTVMSRGLSGVHDELEATIRRAREVRSRPDRGRARGSIPLWKALIIAGILLVSAASVIACFIWFGCSWVVQYVAVVSPATLALINQGC